MGTTLARTEYLISWLSETHARCDCLTPVMASLKHPIFIFPLPSVIFVAANIEVADLFEAVIEAEENRRWYKHVVGTPGGMEGSRLTALAVLVRATLHFEIGRQCCSCVNCSASASANKSMCGLRVETK